LSENDESGSTGGVAVFGVAGLGAGRREEIMIKSVAVAALLGAMGVAHADEGPTFLNGFWRGQGAVIRNGAVGGCFYVFTEFRVENNTYVNTAFKRKCLDAKGQALRDQGAAPGAENVVFENLPAVAVEAKDGKLINNSTVVGSYTNDSVDIRFDIPNYNQSGNRFVWHTHMKLVNGALVTLEDGATYLPDGNVKTYDITYGGVLSPETNDPAKLSEELSKAE
jgi:hypothetical protein